MDYCEDFVEIDLGAEEEDYSEELEHNESNVSDEDALGDANDIVDAKHDANDIVDAKHDANDIVETKQGANDIVETNKLPSVKQIGPEDKTKTHLFDKFYKYLSNNDVKNVRRMLRDYNIFVNLDTRDLNSKYSLDDYKFTKRNGVLTLYKPVNNPSYKEPQTTQTKEPILSNKEPVINPVIIKPVAEEPMSPDNALEPIILHMDNKIADMEFCLQNLENRLDNYRDALNNIIRTVNANTIDTNDNINSINTIANVVDNHAKLINNILKHFRIY